jgi:GNAT superfamily N-acetyltransferase
MKEYDIRSVKENDLEELLILIGEHADFERAPFDPSADKEKLRTALFDQPTRLNCWVVEQQAKLTGYVSFTFDFSTWDAAQFMYMDCLYLQEESRGNGIGAAIINKLTQVARERNCINIQWQTPAFNEPAIRFYHRNHAVSKSKVRFKLKVTPNDIATQTA